MADMPLDDFVQKNHWRGRGRGGFKGRGRGRYQDGGGPGQQRGSVRPKGSAFSRIGPRNGDSNNVNGVSTGDLRDKIATKTKAHVGDLREKLAPKPPPPQPPRTKSYPKMSLTTSRPSRISSSSNRTPSHYAATTTRLQVSHNQTAYGQEPPITLPHSRFAARSLPQFRLPSEAEAKKITVTVPGLTKTTSEVYKREERLAATIMRQKEARQQSYMKSREHFIASSITSAFGGGEKERPPPARVYSKQFRSPSPPPPPPVYHHNPSYGVDYSEPRGIPSSGRPKGVTTVTTMVISNLNTTVSKNDIFELCNAVGPVDTVTIAAPGVAEVTFRYKDDALEAFRKYNQRNLDGQAMICHLQSGVSSRVRGPPVTSYRMSHTDMYPGDAGYSHTRPYYS